MTVSMKTTFGGFCAEDSRAASNAATQKDSAKTRASWFNGFVLLCGQDDATGARAAALAALEFSWRRGERAGDEAVRLVARAEVDRARQLAARALSEDEAKRDVIIEHLRLRQAL